MHHLGDQQRSERDACGIGFVADAQGRASRQILDAALEGLANVRHRGAVAADRSTGDGAGLLLPIPAALVPGPWCGLAHVFLRDESARAPIERRVRAGGHRGRRLADGPGRSRSARRDRTCEPAVDRAARPAAPVRRCPPTRPSSGRIAPAGARRGFRARTSPRCPSARSRTRRSARPTSWARSTRICARGRSRFRSRSSTSASRPTRARRGSARSRSAFSATTARSTRSTATCGRCGDASREPGVAGALEESGSDSSLLDNALELLVRGGRDVRHAAVDAPAPRVAGGSGARSRTWPPSTATTRGSWSRGTGRPRSSSRTGGSSARRSTGTGCGRSAWRAPGRSSPALPRPARCRCARSARVRRGRLGPGELLAVDPGLRPRGGHGDRAQAGRPAPVPPLARRRPPHGRAR